MELLEGVHHVGIEDGGQVAQQGDARGPRGEAGARGPVRGEPPPKKQNAMIGAILKMILVIHISIPEDGKGHDDGDNEDHVEGQVSHQVGTCTLNDNLRILLGAIKMLQGEKYPRQRSASATARSVCTMYTVQGDKKDSVPL